MLAPTTNATNSIYLALFTLIQFPLSHQRNLRLALLGLKAEFGWSLGWHPHRSIGTAPAPLCFYLILINKSSSFSICIIRQPGPAPTFQTSWAWSYLHPGAPPAAHTLSSPLAWFQADAIAAPLLLPSCWLRSCQTRTCCSSLKHDIVPQLFGLISPVFTTSAACVGLEPEPPSHSIHMHKICTRSEHGTCTIHWTYP